MRTRIELIALFLILLFIGMTIQSYQVNATEPTLLKVVNPLTGDEWFNFTSLQKNVGDAFILNVTITDVINLELWQVALEWDPSLLTFINITLPSDHIFHALNPIAAGPDLSTPGEMIYGVAAGPGEPGFTGSGTLAQVALKIMQGVEQSPISFEGIPFDTFLLNSDLTTIPFTAVNGHYEYRVEPTLNVINPLTGDQWFNFTSLQKSVGDAFIVNITITDVTNLGAWQVALGWEPSLLAFVNITLPSDNAFHALDPIAVGPDLSTPGEMVCGASVRPGQTGFTGSGTLAQVALRIVQSVGQSPINFTDIPDITLLLDANFNLIDFLTVNGYFAYPVQPTYLNVINPLTGDQWFNFTSLQKSVGDAFIVNITITDVTNLELWQVALEWDPSLLTFINITLPSDNVFHALNPIVAGPDLSTPGEMIYGVAAGLEEPGFTGSGTLAQVALKIMQGAGQSSISFSNTTDTTFLLDTELRPIDFVTANGYFAYPVQPTYLNVINPLTGDQVFNFTWPEKTVGDTFIVNITVTNAIDLFAWMFVLQWNSSLLSFVNVTVPSDSVFAGNILIVEVIDISDVGTLICACAAGPNESGFTGNGTLAQVELGIIQAVGQSPISFPNIPYSTFLLDSNMNEISTMGVNGHYEFTPRLGDINHDGKIDMRDVSAAVLAFNSFRGTSRWNPYADLDNSGRVDMRDIVLIVLNFDKHA